MKKLLVVTDNKSDKEAENKIKEILLGYEFKTDDYDGAISLVESWGPDLVIFDIRYLRSNIETYEYIRKIKKINQFIKVIIIYAVNNNDEKISGYESGMDDYILAPFAASVLAKKIEKEIALKDRDEFLRSLYRNSQVNEEHLKDKIKILLENQVLNNDEKFSEVLDSGLIREENESLKNLLKEIAVAAKEEAVQELLKDFKAEESFS